MEVRKKQSDEMVYCHLGIEHDRDFTNCLSEVLPEEAWKITANASSALIGGILSGFSSGIFGVGGAIRAAFLSAYDLKRSIIRFYSRSNRYFY